MRQRYHFSLFNKNYGFLETDGKTFTANFLSPSMQRDMMDEIANLPNGGTINDIIRSSYSYWDITSETV